MCIILWSPLSRSFFEVITFWTGGMLRFFFLGRVLRASVAPQGFALGSFPRDGFLLAAYPRIR